MDSQRDAQDTKDSPETTGAKGHAGAQAPPKARDCVFDARTELINRIDEASLKAVLDGLQQGIPGRPAVIMNRQRNQVLQEHSVIQDQVTCLVDMLWKKGEWACRRFLDLLEEVEPALCEDLFGLMNSATTRPTQESDQSPMVSGLKAWIYSQYEVVQEYNALPGEEVLLTDRYTQLLIIEKHRDQEEREQEIRTSGPGFFDARSSEYMSTTVDQFFRPKDHGRVPKAVILQGNSGHGKSFTVQKIILDWASGSLYQDQFALILHLTCKELNVIYKDGVQKSVVDLVSFSETFTPLVLKKLKELPQKVLLLIDGFDELQFPVCETSKCPVKDLSTPAPVEAIMGALLNGSILSECFLLVTTRPTASDYLNKLLKRPVRSTEILGFSEEGVDEYIKRFCKDEQVWKNVSTRVKASETIFTSCFIPVICWIVCTVFRDHLQKPLELTNSLETTTSIFVHFVSILLKHHCRGLRQPVPALLRSLGQLAERGTQKQQVLFSKESVFNTVSDPTSVPFLCKFLLKEMVETQEMFSFMHLSFQEFFTALYYVSDMDEEKVNKLFEYIEQHESRTHLLPVVKFLFGLSHVKVTLDLKKLGMAPNTSMKEQLKEWVIKLIHNNRESNNMMLFTLHCLYELHEKEFVKRAMEVWGEVKFDDIPLTRADCWVLLYCLQCCPTIPSLTLERCNITADKLKMLQPALKRCQELGLHVIRLSDDDVYDLVSAVGEGKTLSKLSVVNSSLSDESVQQILTAVSKQESVGDVHLDVKSITPKTAENLLRFMKSKQTVKSVWLMLNKGANGDDSLCSFLWMKWMEGHCMLNILNCGDLSHIPHPSGLTLGVTLPEISDIMLKEITCRFRQLRRLAENSPEYDEHVDGLMAYLSSLSDLKRVALSADCLTEVWANRILSLIHTCPNLDEVMFGAFIIDTKDIFENGLLLEEGIHLLHEAQIPKRQTIKLIGLRCRTPEYPCRRWRDRTLSCNEEVTIEIPPEKEKEDKEGEELEIPSMKKKKKCVLM